MIVGRPVVEYTWWEMIGYYSQQGGARSCKSLVRIFESYPAGDGSLERVKARVGHGQIFDLERPLTVYGE